MENIKWRDEVMQALYASYKGENFTHGIEHALAVENMVINMAEGLDENIIDLTVLRTAALLHDIGYTREVKNWSVGKVEHIRESINLSKEILSSIPPFRQDKSLLQAVCFLILRHDDTNYSIPIKQNGNGLLLNPEKFEKLIDWPALAQFSHVSLEKMVDFLREADALMATGNVGAARTWEYSINRSLPPVAPANPSNSFMWEESAIGNVRLGAKRALLDSRTKEGRRQAADGYFQVEEFIRKECRRNGIPYEPEPSFMESKWDSQAFGPVSDCNLTSYKDWNHLVNYLRRVSLRGDPTLFPYASAEISSKLISIETLNPLSFYVLKSQIEFQQHIHQSLMNKYALDIFNLSGVIEFNLDKLPITLAPPIVERYKETTGKIKGHIYALVDGLHRCYTAKQLGLKSIRVILITNVAPQFPLVPLPLAWEQIKPVSKVPEISQKRIFRYNTAQDLQHLFEGYTEVYTNREISDNPKSSKFYKYYTFRDLSVIGSDGVRTAPEETDSQQRPSHR